MIRIAAVFSWLGTEVPEVNKLSVACSVIYRFELGCSVVARADKGFRRYADILDQKIETGRNGSRAASSVGI